MPEAWHKDTKYRFNSERNPHSCTCGAQEKLPATLSLKNLGEVRIFRAATRNYLGIDNELFAQDKVSRLLKTFF